MQEKMRKIRFKTSIWTYLSILFYKTAIFCFTKSL